MRFPMSSLVLPREWALAAVGSNTNCKRFAWPSTPSRLDATPKARTVRMSTWQTSAFYGKGPTWPSFSLPMKTTALPNPTTHLTTTYSLTRPRIRTILLPRLPARGVRRAAISAWAIQFLTTPTRPAAIRALASRPISPTARPKTRAFRATMGCFRSSRCKIWSTVSSGPRPTLAGRPTRTGSSYRASSAGPLTSGPCPRPTRTGRRM